METELIAVLSMTSLAELRVSVLYCREENECKFRSCGAGLLAYLLAWVVGSNTHAG